MLFVFCAAANVPANDGADQRYCSFDLIDGGGSGGGGSRSDPSIPLLQKNAFVWWAAVSIYCIVYCNFIVST